MRIKKLILLNFFTFACPIITFCFSGNNPPTDTITKDGGHIQKLMFLPAIIKTPETKIGVGFASGYFFKAKKSDSLIRTSNIELVGLYTQRKQILIELGANVYFAGEKYILKSHNSYSHFPDKFWGLGNYTPKTNKEDYVFEQVYFLPTLQRKLYKSFFAGINYEFQNVFTVEYQNYPRQSLFERQQITGRQGGIISGGGIQLGWDNRSNAFSSDKGSYIQLSYSRFNNLFGSQFKFSIYNLDLRKYITIFKKQVLAFQVYGNFTDGNPPLRNLSPLGGPNLMRGYYMGRYRDKDMIVVQAEYRIPIWERLGMVIFGGFGEVAPKLNEFSLWGIKPSMGSGVRFALKKKEKLNLRLDFGFGYHSSAAYIIVTEAF